MGKHIGTGERLAISKSLQLPLDAVTSTFALLAVRGAGKSNAGAAMAEEMFKASLPFVVVDPVGCWYGLRSGRDGDPTGGLPVPIFGGKHGDVPLERGSGQFIADLIVEKRLSCVLDLFGFPSEGDKKAFLLAFAQRLYQRNEDPLHLFLEEADDYIPQKPMRDETQLLRAWENIVRRGRARGLGMTLITQRSAAINKMVLTQVETLFVLRTTGPQDVAAIDAWVKYHQVDAQLLASLAALDDGEAWVWSPHYLHKIERFRFRLRETFDSGATPKNIRGKDSKRPATLADVDLGALRERIASTIERAKQEDPKELRWRIAELEREVKQTPPAPPATTIVQVPAVSADVMDKLESTANELTQVAREIMALLPRATAHHPMNRHAEPPPKRAPAQRPRTVAPVTADSGDVISGGERKILSALAQYPEGRTKVQVAILTGYASNGGGFRNYLGALRSRGWIDGSDRLRITAAGLDALGEFKPLPTGVALLEHWRSRLSKAERLALDALAEAYPKALTKEQIAYRAGYEPEGGGFRNALGKLRTLELIRGRGALRASDDLFV